MPAIDLIPFLDVDGSVPLFDWLDSIPAKAQIVCTKRLEHLAANGHELRRPIVEYLRGTDLYELRVKVNKINFRILILLPRSRGRHRQPRVQQRGRDPAR